ESLLVNYPHILEHVDFNHVTKNHIFKAVESHNHAAAFFVKNIDKFNFKENDKFDIITYSVIMYPQSFYELQSQYITEEFAKVIIKNTESSIIYLAQKLDDSVIDFEYRKKIVKLAIEYTPNAL